MNKYLFIIAATLIGLSSCTQENDYDENAPYTGNFQVSADFIDLGANKGMEQAGSLVVNSKEGEVKVKWISDSSFNLDTTQTSIPIKGGKGVLPIKWQKKQENGNYAPEHVWFKAGVLLTSGDEERFIPLYNVQKLDSAKVRENIQTRTAGEPTPRISSIEIIPAAPEMGESGATVIIRLLNVQQVVVNYAAIKDIHNINVNETNLPTLLTATQNILSFRWKDANVRSAAFVLPIELFASELVNTVNFSLTWNPGASSIPADQYIEVAGTKWAKGNLKYENGVYSFMSSQELFTGVHGEMWNAETNTDYWPYNTLTPTLLMLNNGDPCKMVSPVGGWRMPTKIEFEALIKEDHVGGTYNNVKGTYFGVTAIPPTTSQSNTLFLPNAGMINDERLLIYSFVIDRDYYWVVYRGSSNDIGGCSLVGFHDDKNFSVVDYKHQIEGEKTGHPIRCVVNQ